MSSENRKIKRKYRLPRNSIYSSRFFENLSSYYSLFSNEKRGSRDLFSFEPKECRINNLLKERNSYDIEQIINSISYSLMAFGEAYLYISPKYTTKRDEEGIETQVLSSFKIGEIRGIIKRKTKEEYLFCSIGFNSDIREIKIAKPQLIIFGLNELGFSKRYFKNILKKFSKCDITANSMDMINNHSDIYDYVYHSERTRITELKAVRKIGWSSGTEKLSDSYSMYKKIQGDELKLRFIKYIVNRINHGLQSFFGDGSGELVAHINEKDYEKLWNNYSEGKITGTELSSILYGF